MSPKNGMSEISGRWTIGIRSTSGVPEEPISDRYANDVTPEREDVDRGAGDDLVRAEVDREERVDQRRQAARRHRREQADRPRQRLRRDPEAPEAAHQHHALDGDVDDAGALGHDAAEAAEHERGREPQRRGEQAGRDDVPTVAVSVFANSTPEMPPTAPANSARPPSRTRRRGSRRAEQRRAASASTIGTTTESIRIGGTHAAPQAAGDHAGLGEALRANVGRRTAP